MNLVWTFVFNLFHVWTLTNYANCSTAGLLLSTEPSRLIDWCPISHFAVQVLLCWKKTTLLYNKKKNICCWLLMWLACLLLTTIKALSCLQIRLEWVLTPSVRFNDYFARVLLKIWLRLFLIDWFQILLFRSHVFSCWKRKQFCQIIPTRKHLLGFNDIYRLVLVNQLPAMQTITLKQLARQLSVFYFSNVYVSCAYIHSHQRLWCLCFFRHKGLQNAVIFAQILVFHKFLVGKISALWKDVMICITWKLQLIFLDEAN